MKFSASIFIATTATLASLTKLGAAAPVGQDDTSSHDLAARQQTCVPNGVFWDDNFYKVPLEYRGDWTHLTNQGDSVNAGTLSYTGEPNAMIILPDPFPAGEYVTADVTVWSTKKYDRGQFNVYVGHTLIGTGDQYSSASEETDTQIVFQRKNVRIPGGEYFVIKNDKGASYMAFDAFQLDFCNY